MICCRCPVPGTDVPEIRKLEDTLATLPCCPEKTALNQRLGLGNVEVGIDMSK